jgi:acylglycerol lipase
MQATASQPVSSSAGAAIGPAPVLGTLRCADGTELVSYHWPVPGTPRATIALAHGMAEHAGRYQAFAAYCQAQGFELWSLDLRGHGRSPGRRLWIDRFDQYLDDADALLAAARRNDNVPLFLMGHSMGGAIAALYAVERAAALSRPLAGLVLSSPALAPGRQVPRWMLAMSHFMSRVWPTFPALKIDAKLLSRDPAIVAANLADPLVYHGAVPARAGAELLNAMTRIAAGRDTLRMPVLVFHGTADQLTEPEGSREFGAQAGAPDLTLTLYEGNYHETLNDIERERVLGDLFGWLRAHLPATD